MGKLRYSDRAVYQICRHGPEPFNMSKLVDDVLERMTNSGEKITTRSRGCVMSHLLQLKRQRLLIRGPDGELGLSTRFAEVVEKLWKDPTFTEHSLLKNKALIDLRVFRTKNTTKKELYEENDDLQDRIKQLEETVARLNRVIDSFCTAEEERDAAIQERDAAVETLRSLRATLRITPTDGTRNGHQPMEVDTDEATQSGGHVLQRVPTMPDIVPSTPRRNPSAQLLTPPPTEEQSRRRLARTSVSLSYRDFEEQPDGRPVDTSGQSQAHGAPSEGYGSHTQLEGGTSSTAVVNAGEESFFDIQRRIARLADQAVRKEYEDRARMKDLEQQLTVARERAVDAEGRAVGAEQRAHAAEQKATASDAAKAELEAKLLEDIAQHNQQVADYEARLKRSKAECLEQSLLTQEARAEAAHMRQNYAVLNRRLVQAVEQSGRVSTLANVRIAELSAEVVDGLNIVYQMGQRAQDLMQGIVAGATSFAQNIAGQWPLAWQGN
ncbi:hypothetical protein VTO73DRAFT_2554 [Trametes versicolor]